MAFLSLNLEPLPVHFGRAIGEARKELRDWRPVWAATMPLVTPDVLATVRAHGAPIGASWPALSDAYAKRKAREGHGSEHYVYSGRFTAGLSSGDHRQRMGRMAMQWGPKPKYTYPLNFGSAHVPERQFIGLSAGVRTQIMEAMERRAGEVMARAEERAVKG